MLQRNTVNFAFAIALLASSGAQAVTLYKLVDSKGGVTYTESPPYGFNGKVVPVDIAFDTTPVPPKPPQAAVTEKAEVNAPTPQPDYLTKRRATRAALEMRLTQARQALDNAKLALANATMEPDEAQIIMVPTTKQPRPGEVVPGNPPSIRTDPKMCGEVVRNGKRVHTCGRVVGNENFVARMNQLEEGVKRAEEEVAEAETAWRRGVD